MARSSNNDQGLLAIAGNDLTFNAQAALTFTLINTNLVALFKKEGDTNTFLVTPTDEKPSGGMTIAEMIEDINKMLQNYDPAAQTLNADDVANAVKDANDASKKKSAADAATEDSLEDIDYKSIKVELRQAFLLLTTGKPIEYAFEIDVDISTLFPSGQTFFNVQKLSLGFWNTKKKSVLERMGIIDFNDYVKIEE